MNYKEFAVSLAQEAGKIIKQGFLEQRKVDWKLDDSPVSNADLTVHALVEEKVSESFPNHGLLSEEAKDTRELSNEFVWVCDPIDGTYPYIHNIPTATFSLALVQDGQPILGVIYDPLLENLYFAEKGQGAQLNGEPITVCDKENFDHTITGITLWGKAKYNLAPLIAEFQKELTLPVNLGANVYMGALVAAGKMAGVIYNDDKPYDAAAIKIIVEEAGGKVTDLEGNEQRYDQIIRGMVATNGKLHEDFLKKIRLHRDLVFKKSS